MIPKPSIPLCHQILNNRLFLAEERVKATWGERSATCEDAVDSTDCIFFTLDDTLVYRSFCDDFGPMNLSHIFHFIESLQAILDENPRCKVVYYTESDRRSITNAAFLLGCYMILNMNISPSETWSAFSELELSFLVPYRDSSYRRNDFPLHLVDCWQAISLAANLGWIKDIDLDEYRHYESPLEGDLHIVIPDRLIAFRGPQSLPDNLLYLDKKGCRFFSPTFYAEPFRDMNVSLVVRLNDSEYSDSEFTSHGFQHMDLDYGDSATPTPAAASAFVQAYRAASGAVAVHCMSGLGRTGTLAALIAMCEYGFSAEAAVAWVRVVRPGSVVGEQQHFLRRIDQVHRASILESVAAGEDEGEADESEDSE